ncbi:Sucrose synthase [subsurface metagenome]
MLGRVPNVSDVYNACSVYVQPSVVEGFGIEVLEAMAHGRPVIASEGAGASDLVDDSIGFVVPIRSPEAIAERLNLLKSMPHYGLMQMGQRARRKAKNYTWEKIRKRYAKLWSL